VNTDANAACLARIVANGIRHRNLGTRSRATELEEAPEARGAVYRNRRRIRARRANGCCGSAASAWSDLAHLYEMGGMRRVHLLGRTDIRKRLLIHTAGFNLGLLMRQLLGVARRGLQGRFIAMVSTLLALTRSLWTLLHIIGCRDNALHRLTLTRPLTSPLHSPAREKGAVDLGADAASCSALEVSVFAGVGHRREYLSQRAAPWGATAPARGSSDALVRRYGCAWRRAF
jgi:hypothetical protein